MCPVHLKMEVYYVCPFLDIGWILKNPALAEFQPSAPDYPARPFQYFTSYSDAQIISYISYQTNLGHQHNFLHQWEGNNDLSGCPHLYGCCFFPVEDHWAMETRVPEVANLMSSRRFRFYKELSTSMTTLRSPAPVIVSSKSGHCLAFSTMPSGVSHNLPWCPSEAWTKNAGCHQSDCCCPGECHVFPTTTAIFAVRYLRDQNGRYTGTARNNRIRNPVPKSIKEMEKKTVPRGDYGYATSDDGILAVRWKDNRTLCQYCHSAVNRHGGGVDVLSRQVLQRAHNEGACESSKCHQKL